MRLKKLYSSREVASMTGLSARQLQWWDSRRLFQSAVASQRTAAGGYTERRYTPLDVLELQALADLRRRGFSIPRLRHLLDTLRDVFRIRLYEAIGDGGPMTLFVGGDEIFARALDGRLFNLDEPRQRLGGRPSGAQRVRGEETYRIDDPGRPPAGVRDDDLQANRLGHQRKALLWIAGVERHVRGAGLETAENQHRQPDRTFDTDPDQIAGLDAGVHERCCDSVGPLVEVAVAELDAPVVDRRPDGRPRDLFSKELLETRADVG